MPCPYWGKGNGGKNEVAVWASNGDRGAAFGWHRQECLCYLKATGTQSHTRRILMAVAALLRGRLLEPPLLVLIRNEECFSERN